jgi:hypothetical protein
MSIAETKSSAERGLRAGQGQRLPAGAEPFDDRSPITTAAGWTVSVPVDPLRILLLLLAAVAILVILGSVLPSPAYEVWFGRESWAMDLIGQRFDLDGEGNIPAFFSAIQLLACGVVLAIIAGHSWRARNRWRFHWTLLAVGFVVMAVDEAAQLHELLILPGLWIAGRIGVENPNYMIWIPAALVLVVPVAFAFIPFLLALPVRIGALMSAAGALFAAGAMGVEAIAASIWQGDFESLGYHWLVVVEEGLEMAAISLFLATLLLVLAMHVEAKRFTIDIRINRRP